MRGYRETNTLKEVKNIQEMLSNEFCDEQVLRSLQVSFEQDPSASNKFQYASGLRQSQDKDRRENAIVLFKTLTNNEIYSRDSFYYIALTYYSLGDYRSSLYFCEELYRYEPDNEQIKTLHTAILSKFEGKSLEQARQETLKMGIGFGILAIGIGIAISLIRKK